MRRGISIRPAVFIMAFLAISGFALLAFLAVALDYSMPPKSREKIGEVRNVPYPFRSMLAVCSDIDGSTLREFEVIHRYLNTLEEDTYFGKGLGLDIADSFWMFAVNDNGEIIDYDGAQNAAAMSYFRPGASELKNNEEIIKYFKCGWIDAIHSYGDFSRINTSNPVFTKKHAEIANKEMTEHSLLPSIWINHGNSANVQNLRKKVSIPALWYQQGSNPASEYYHADFTIASGIKYVWFSNPSSRYAVDTPLYPVTMLDGQKVWGFNRYTGEGGVIGHRYNWSSFDFNEQVSARRLDKLVESGGVAIVAQHFGAANGDYVFTGETREGFERLKRYEENKDILVARTSRLLEFVRIRDFLSYTYMENPDGTETITIHSVEDPVLGTERVDTESLKGISFNVKKPETAKIYVENRLVEDAMLVKSTPGEQKGVIGFKWHEKDFTDYTKTAQQ